MTESQSRLAGLRYARLVRCSTDPQADTSIPDQIRVLDECARQFGLVHAGPDADFILPGISGSHPAAREDIGRIIRRKEQENDFDVLLVQDLSRLTRGGVEHGGKIEFDLAAANIRLVFAGTQVPEGDHAGILKSVEYYAAQQYAKSVSFGAARGQMSAILSGRQAHCLRPPFAVDRLYVSTDGRPQHVVRNRTDGTQQKLDPTTGSVVQTYPRPVKGQSPIRCRKQAGERVVLIPGAAEAVETVRRMFRRVLDDGWGDWRVAKELNDGSVPSPNGKRWTRQSVKVILRNPIYTGIGLANRRSGARYHERGQNAPKKLNYELTDIARQKRPPNRHRPRTEWVEQPHPALEDFLGGDLRERVIAYQRQYLTGAPKAAPVKKDKHVDSLFVLKGILRSKQGDLPMTGRTQGTREKPYRYYSPSRSSAYPCSDRTLRRTVPAEPIERAVLSAIGGVLSHPTTREQVIEAMRQQNAAATTDDAELARLRREQDDLRGQVEFVIDTLTTLGKDAARRKIQQLEGRLAAVNDRIAAAAPKKVITATDHERAADAVVARLATLSESYASFPAHALRELVASMAVRLEVDLETRALTLELALPAWAFDASGSVEARLGVDGNFLRTAPAEAQSVSGDVAFSFDCGRPVRSCYTCRRVAA
jgi:hypothetical protein